MNGWYYDLQLENPLTSVSLHPNQKYDEKLTEVDIFGSVPYEWSDFDSNCDEDYYFNGETSGCGYSKTPIASAIISEDFNVSVANQWTPVGGDGGVSQIWNSVRSSSPYLPVVIDLLKEGGEYLDEGREKQKAQGNTITAGAARVAGNIFDTVAGIMSGINNSDRLNQNLVIQNTRFSYYAGSGTAFNNLALRYTIFPKWEIIYERDNNGNLKQNSNGDPIISEKKYLSVTDQIRKLLPYCNGYFEESSLATTINFILSLFSSNEGISEMKEDMREIKSKISNWKTEISNRWKNAKDKEVEYTEDGKKKKKINFNTLTNIIQGVTRKSLEQFNLTVDEIDKKFTGMISWQHAPGGYIPSFKDIDKPQKGTLKLRIGTQYSIHSLLCNDISFNFSKILVKDKNNRHDPLYCDVNLTLAPATKFSNKMLEQFVGLTNHSNNNRGNFRKPELSGFDDKLLEMQSDLYNYFNDINKGDDRFNSGKPLVLNKLPDYV